MSDKWTTDRAKNESENVVLRTLVLSSPQRWKDLLAKTKLSSRTLKKALNRLEQKGRIYRQMEQTKEYPPPVLYGITPEAQKSISPMLFSVLVHDYALGLIPDHETIGGNEKAIGMFFKAEKEKPSERLALLVQRLGVLQLFVLLKALEERNFDWTNEISRVLEYDERVEKALSLSNENTRWVFFDDSLEESEKQRIKESELKENDLLFSKSVRTEGDINFLMTSGKKSEMPERQAVKNLQDILRQLYPEEIKKFEELAQKASSVDKGASSSKTTL